MRSNRLPLALSVLLASLAACAAPTEDDADEQTANVTGGSSKVESPTVFLFEESARETPKCMGALVADTFAVTMKSCAKEGMTLSRAKGKDAVKVKAVHVPEEEDAEIAVVELDKAIKGTHARITHMPLRSGYAVNGVAAKDGSGLFAADEGDASQIQGSMIEETALYGAIKPKTGSEICAGDLGAPVCSTTGTKLFGIKIVGTCGLSGLITAPTEAPAQAAAQNLAEEGEGQQQGPAQTEPQQGENAPEPLRCSDRPWKVVQIGRYAEFIKQYAPRAFEPLRIDKPILRNIRYVPEGLWGYKTGGTVKSCKIDTTTLATTAPGAASPAITATVSFEDMQERAAAWGRFGIAPKSDPTNIKWLPAKPLGETRGKAFEAKFEGVVSAETEGDYVVAFRASANGGETWIECDTDGIENGFDIANGISLKVAPVEPSTEPSSPSEPPPSTSPQDAPPSADEGNGYSDPPPYTSDEEEYTGPDDDEEEEAVFGQGKKKSDSGGCSASGATPASSGLPLLGVLVGLAALTRRRKS